MKSVNVAIASERKQRKLAATLISDSLTAEMGAFSVSEKGKDPTIIQAPFVYYANFIAKVSDMISHHIT